MTSTPLIFDDLKRDASDCLAAFEQGLLSLRGVSADGQIDFGVDGGDWSNNGECNDMRFEGPAMTEVILLFEDIMQDATDCSAAFDAGQLKLAAD